MNAVGSISPMKRALLFALIAGGGFLADWGSKEYVFRWRGWPSEQQEIYWLIPNYLGLQTSVNHGALFGMGAGMTLVFVALSFVALAAIGYFAFWHKPPLSSFLFCTIAMVTAGILGNLFDRMGWHHSATTPDWVKYGVRDWILFQCPAIPLAILNPWPNFNIADCFLVVGSIVLAWQSFLVPENETNSATLESVASSTSSP